MGVGAHVLGEGVGVVVAAEPQFEFGRGAVSHQRELGCGAGVPPDERELGCGAGTHHGVEGGSGGDLCLAGLKNISCLSRSRYCRVRICALVLLVTGVFLRLGVSVVLGGCDDVLVRLVEFLRGRLAFDRVCCVLGVVVCWFV